MHTESVPIPAPLLEREEAVATMARELAAARAGRGRVLFISGEAGIGKTALVERFERSCGADIARLFGACDALATPRPLGPLIDIGRQTGGALMEAIEAGRPAHRVYHLALDALVVRGAAATLVVIEDAHWIDDAGADALKYLVRRIARVPVMMVVTYRAEEIGAGHPLRSLLSDVAPDHASRIELRPLSAMAVQQLADRNAYTGPDLYRLTSGNPLLVAELLSHAGAAPTLRDVLAMRLQRLSAAARELAELVAVVPDRIERRLLEATFPACAAALQECLDRGLLEADAEHVRYRHELSRGLVDEGLPAPRRSAAHAAVLSWLVAAPRDAGNLARIVHHADGARDADAVVAHAPAAAEEAMRRGARRQAAAFLRTALRYADRATVGERARWLDGLATALAWSDADAALEANQQAFDAWCIVGDRRGQGLNRCARFELLHVGMMRRDETGFTELPRLAMSLLDADGSTGALARACVNAAYVETLQGRNAEAQALHSRAIAVAKASADPDGLAYVLLQGEHRKQAFACEPDREPLQQALGLALSRGNDPLAAHAYFLLAIGALGSLRLAEAGEAIEDGLRFAEERDLDVLRLQLEGFRVRCLLHRGEAARAEASAERLLATGALPGIAAFSALMTTVAARSRRGGPCAGRHADELLALANGRVGVASARTRALLRRAESAWLLESEEAARAAAAAAWQSSAAQAQHPWLRGEAAFWWWRAGGSVGSGEEMARPYALQLSGDWAAAARAWGAMGMPYEEALALIDGDRAAQRRAVELLHRLGASAAIERCRRLLAERGVRQVPRGARAVTRGNASGLTPREIEVLGAIGEGLHNAEAAQRLRCSAKTVAHHVSSILGKLGARSRTQAVHVARTRGLLGPPG